MKKSTLEKKFKIQDFRILLILVLFCPQLYAQWEPVQFFGSDLADSTPTSVSFNNEGTIMAAGFERSLEFAGRVIVYSEVDGDWQPLGSPIVGQIENGEFGGEVALNASGDRLLISQRSTVSVNDIPGGYMVFEFVNNQWQQLGNTMEFPEGIRFQSFAKSLAFNDAGDRVVLTSGLDIIDSVFTGNVTVFDFDGQDWLIVGETITSNSGIANDFFGAAVAIDATGERLVISAAGDADGFEGPANLGYASIYEFINGDWQELAILDNPENFVFSNAVVAMSSDGSIVSVSSNNDSLNASGPFEFRTRVFESTDGQTWTQIGEDIVPPFDSEPLTRRDIEINNDGTLLAISYSVRLPSDDIDGSGQILFYERNGDSWDFLEDTIIGNNDVFAFYGESIALNGTGDAIAIVNFGWEDGNSGGLLEIYKNDNILSAAAFTESPITMYPNPSRNNVNIDFGNSPYSGQIKVLDMSGRIVLQESVAQSNNYILNHNFNPGVYLVQFRNTALKLIVD